MTGREALNSALDVEISTETEVDVAYLFSFHNCLDFFVQLGEYQGAYKISKGLLENYGSERVIANCRGWFTGIACAAFSGLKPIVRAILPVPAACFILVFIDGCALMLVGVCTAIVHEINSAAKINYTSAGHIPSPIVFRGPNGAASGQLLLCIPRSIQLFRPGGWLAAKLVNEGNGAEIINLRSVRLLYRATTTASVRKTNRLITFEGVPQHGIGAEICVTLSMYMNCRLKAMVKPLPMKLYAVAAEKALAIHAPFCSGRHAPSANLPIKGANHQLRPRGETEQSPTPDLRITSRIWTNMRKLDDSRNGK
ncbi:hypothetical protein Ancab_001604 [Ancistrocladus abbreviatus]